MNHELQQMYEEVDVVKRLKNGRLRWAGYVLYVPGEQQRQMIYNG